MEQSSCFCIPPIIGHGSIDSVYVPMKCNNGWSLVQKYELITTSSHFLASGFGDHSPGRTQITLRESRDGGVSHIIGYVFLSKRNGEINGRLHCTKQGGGCLTYVVDNQDVDELHETIRNYCSVREMRIGERRGTRTRGTDLINPLQDPGRGFATQGRTTEEGETELGMEKNDMGGKGTSELRWRRQLPQRLWGV